MGLEIRIKKEDLIAFLLVFPFIPVNALDYISADILYDILAVIDVGVILCIMLQSHYRMSVPDIFLAIFTIILCVSCIANGRSVIPAIYYGGKFFAFVIINSYYLRKHSTTMLKVTFNYMTVLIIINTIIQFINQDAFGHQIISGNFNNFLIGDNLLGYNYVPYIALGIILDEMEIGKVRNRTSIMIAVCLISLLRAWSAKSIIGITMVLIYLLFVYRKEIAHFFNFEVLTVVFIVAFIGVVFLGIQDNFSFIIENILRRDTTLTGRTYIWQSTLDLIRKSPWIGYGTVNGGMLEISSSRAGNDVGSHNIILEVLLQTGFIGLTMYLGFLVTSIKKPLNKLTPTKKDNYLMLLFMIFVILIMFLTSMAIYTVIMYLPMVLCFNIENLNFISDKKESG